MAAMAGATLRWFSSPCARPPKSGSISHSGCSQATACSVLPRTVSVQINSRSPKSAGTVTLKIWRLLRV